MPTHCPLTPYRSCPWGAQTATCLSNDPFRQGRYPLRLHSHYSWRWPKFLMWHRSVTWMTVWTAQSALKLTFSNQIWATVICGFKSGLIFGDETSVWTVKLKFVRLLCQFRTAISSHWNLILATFKMTIWTDRQKIWSDSLEFSINACSVDVALVKWPLTYSPEIPWLKASYRALVLQAHHEGANISCGLVVHYHHGFLFRDGPHIVTPLHD